MLWEISEERRVNPSSEIYLPGDLLPYTLRGISRKFALLLGKCRLPPGTKSAIRHVLDKYYWPYIILYLYILICTVTIATKRFTVFASRRKNDYLYLLSYLATSSDNF
jgi:hypothetical protein